MIFRSLTRHREIGANSYLLQTEKHRFILDAGMHPKEAGLKALPDYSQVPTNSIDGILISHSHHDHIGSLPVLQARQPSAQVWMTEATGELTSAMLHNSVSVMSRQREEHNILEYPLFSHGDVDDLKVKWNYHRLNHGFPLGKSDVECTFYDAGHIMGSVGMLLQQNGKKLFYTGDVNFEPQTISCAADFPTEKMDAVVVETTRGDYARPEGFTRKGEKERLAQLIRDTYARGGSVLMPVFALGKSQELLLTLDELRKQDLIPDMPVMIGGLSTKITVLYDAYCTKVRRSYEGFRILEDMTSLVAPRRRRKELSYNPRTIYALSSGMMTEGTTSNFFAQNFLGFAQNSVAFVGYTDPATPGFRVRHAKKGEQIRLNGNEPPVSLQCQVESFDFSAHSTRESICEYLVKVQPKKVLLVHGDEPAMNWFRQTLPTMLPESEIMAPEPRQEVVLW